MDGDYSDVHSSDQVWFEQNGGLWETTKKNSRPDSVCAELVTNVSISLCQKITLETGKMYYLEYVMLTCQNCTSSSIIATLNDVTTVANVTSIASQDIVTTSSKF